MELSSFLKEIILIHDCVIIPDLGGFIANYHPATIDNQKNTLHAPSREIAFNSKLSKNDGVLINWLVEEKGMTYSDASDMVSAFVLQTIDQLNQGKTISFQQIGTLELDKNHNLVFEPQQNENLLLDSFGLDSFLFHDLASKQQQTTLNLTSEQKETVKRLLYPRQLRRIAIAGSLLLALCAIPEKNNHITMATSSVLPALTEIQPKQVNNETITSIHSVEVAPATLRAKKAAIKTILNNGAEQKCFHIIVGSFKQQSNAKNFKIALSKAGHEPRLFPLKNGYYRVSIDSYANQQEAISALKKINTEFSAWILRT